MRLKRLTHHQARFAPALATIGLFLLAVLAPGGASSAAPLPLVTFSTADPQKPSWTVLELDVPPGGASPKLEVDFVTARCPLVWGFIFLGGSPQAADVIQSLTFDWSGGTGGYRIWTDDAYPVELDESQMTAGGTDWCYSLDFEALLGALPAGTVYLLEYTAGVPFDARAHLSFDAPVQVVRSSQGDSTFYINSTDFQGGAHVAVYSPARQGFCDPLCSWSGGEWGFLDAGKDRQATHSFEHHPHFVFTSPSAGRGTSGSVTKISVIDPAGGVTTNGGATPSLGGYALYGGGIRTSGTQGLPPGEYIYDIRLNAEASTRSTAWHVFGADYWFPGEEP